MLLSPGIFEKNFINKFYFDYKNFKVLNKIVDNKKSKCSDDVKIYVLFKLQIW